MKEESKCFWVSPYKMVTCWSLLYKYGDVRPFCPHDVVVPQIEILLDFLDFSYFCHILLHAYYNYIFWQISFHLSHMTMPRDVLSLIKIKNLKHIRSMEIILVYYYKLEVCLVVWMLYKLVCENMVNMVLKHLICIHSLAHLTIYSLIVI